MAKSKTKRNRILLIAAILAVAGLGIWYATRSTSSTAKKTTPATTETKKVAETNTTKTDATINKDEPAKVQSSSDTSSNKVYIMVNRPVTNDTLKLADGIQFRSTISGANSGTCSLTAEGPNGKTVTKSAAMATQTSYGSCNLDIASSEIVAGDWTLTLTVTAGSTTSKATVKVKVQ